MAPTEQPPPKTLLEQRRELEQATKERIEWLLNARVELQKNAEAQLSRYNKELKDLGYHNTRSRVAKDGAPLTPNQQVSEIKKADSRKRAAKAEGE